MHVPVAGTPGKPGALALDPDQMLDYGDRMAGFTNDMALLGQDLDVAKSQLPEALADIGRNFTHTRDEAQGDFAGRGIFQSSIKDIQLADISAQQALQEKSAHDIVDAAQRAYTMRQQQIEGAGGERQRLNTWRNNAMAANAAANTTPGTPATVGTLVDRDPRKPGIQSKPPAPVRVTVHVGGSHQAPHRTAAQRRRARIRRRHRDPYARV